ncbi:hypothetical protein Xcel_3324 [Xylanimonas cellulosilytica DSM 15894]|uniref:DUF4386 family protein n=1 Tax=Xylanimonas cellulosilytica (strain DSM 15894 / JCM 12276 / CECT 5975 / KCTC 9989 / LMG 20990 / NBRC 107835 / XIL07) TaxID=446471 RepID=D1BRQ8_XYLCX|nr:hypothetical protein [Xylanimonas cellulosilytica]ACZ32324.1 hypothetical protein Xcel_3324 [Xylanimonas cellulosilytica DSM 15894]
MTASEVSEARTAEGVAPRHRIRPVAFAGVLVTVFLFAANPPEAPADPTADALRTFYEANVDAITFYALSGALAAAALVLVAAHLRAMFAAARPTWLPDAVFGAGLLSAAWLLVSMAFAALPVLDGARFQPADAMVEAFFAIGLAGDTLAVTTLVIKAILLVGTGVLVLRTRRLGAWFGWLSVVLGALCAAALLPLPGVFYGGMFGFALWPSFLTVAEVVTAMRARRR